MSSELGIVIPILEESDIFEEFLVNLALTLIRNSILAEVTVVAVEDSLHLNEDTYMILAEVLEFIMENPANRQWLKHAGGKGGSTASVFTKASYASTKKEQRFEIIYFFNNLTDAENTQLQKWSNTFELAILSNPAFREKLKTTLL